MKTLHSHINHLFTALSGKTENWDLVKSGRECLQRCSAYNPTNTNETYTSRHSTIEERPLLRDFRRFKRPRKDPHDTRTATPLLRVSPTQQCILHLSDTPPPNTRHSFGAFLRYKVGDLGSGIRGNCSLKDPSFCGNESGKSKKDDFGNQLCF